MDVDLPLYLLYSGDYVCRILAWATFRTMFTEFTTLNYKSDHVLLLFKSMCDEQKTEKASCTRPPTRDEGRARSAFCETQLQTVPPYSSATQEAYFHCH